MVSLNPIDRAIHNDRLFPSMSVERACLFHWLEMAQSLAASNASCVQDVSDHAEHIASVKRAVQLSLVLTPGECAILSRTYEATADSRADSVQSVSWLIDAGGSRTLLAALRAFRTKLTKELTDVCLDLIHLADNALRPQLFPRQAEGGFLSPPLRLDRPARVPRQHDRLLQGSEGDRRGRIRAASPDYLALIMDFCTFLRDVAAMPVDAAAVGAAAYEAALGTSEEPESSELVRRLREISLLTADAPT